MTRALQKWVNLLKCTAKNYCRKYRKAAKALKSGWGKNRTGFSGTFRTTEK
jgi:hypothetical protein